MDIPKLEEDVIAGLLVLAIAAGGSAAWKFLLPAAWSRFVNWLSVHSWARVFLIAIPVSLIIMLAGVSWVKAEMDREISDLRGQLAAERAELAGQISGVTGKVMGLSDSLGHSLVHPAKTISINGGGLTSDQCPDGSYLVGLRAKQNSGGSYAAQSIVVLEAECRKLLP